MLLFPSISYCLLLSQNLHFTKKCMFCSTKTGEKSFCSSDKRPLKKISICLFACFALFSLQLPNEGLLADGLIDGGK